MRQYKAFNAVDEDAYFYFFINLIMTLFNEFLSLLKFICSYFINLIIKYKKIKYPNVNNNLF